MHVGHECSFVYDIADLYKAEVTIPIAFEMAAQQPEDLPSATRRRVRDAMVSAHILERMVRDIHILFSDDEWIAEWEFPQKLFIYGMTKKERFPTEFLMVFRKRNLHDCNYIVRLFAQSTGRLVQMAD